MYEQPFLENYKKLRTGWWLGLTAAWLGIWYWQLSRPENPGRDCSGIIGDVGCAASDGISAIGLVVGLFFALITSPLLLIPARYIAKYVTDQEVEAANKNAQEQEAKRIAQVDTDRKQRMKASDRAAEAARGTIHRTEFIQKLGTVGDLLRLLADEDDKAEIRQLKVGVSQSLRDLTAKHTVDDLARFIRSDASIRLALAPILTELKEAGLGLSSEAAILNEALSRAG